MKGDKVIVRSFGDKPLVRMVWEITSSAVFICTEENFSALSRGNNGLWPVGFPKECVYRYNPKINLNAPIVWDQLTVYGN